MSLESFRYCWGCEREHSGFFISFPRKPDLSAAWVQKWNDTFDTERKAVTVIRVCNRWYQPGTAETKKGQKRTKIPTFIRGLDGKQNDIRTGNERDVRM